jgi:arabinofuranan 3-O-arabinosyltransferase
MILQSINLTRVALALVVSYLAVLGFSYGRDHGFLIDAAGKPRLTEYIGVRAAGELVRAGKPAAAYDWDAHKARHDAISGQTEDGYYPWAYPPPYLLVAGALALMPYLLSVSVWIVSTLALQLWAMIAITGTSRAALWLLAAPPTFINVSVIHTGFLVAALLGLGVHLLAVSPVAAGVAVGLLAFKPQLGILIPVALVAGGYWRTIFAAALTVAALCAVSVLAFGVEPWLAYPAQLERFTETFRAGRLNLAMLVSVYGLGRTLGLGHTAALVPQAIVFLVAAAATYKLWRGDDDFALKAAGLIAASLLASPYLFPYDLTVLVVVLGFLYRVTGVDGFDGLEVAVIAAAGGFIFAAPDAPFPAGLVANVLVAALVVRRWSMAPQRRGVPQANQRTALAA